MTTVPLTLPSLDAFEALTLEAREALFIRWVKAQRADREYVFANVHNCPLAQFGSRIARRKAKGGGYEFHVGKREVLVLNPAKRDGLSQCRTFGALADSFSS